MKNIITKAFVLLVLSFVCKANIQAQETNYYYVAFELAGEDVSTYHSRWKFEFSSSSIVTYTGAGKSVFNYTHSDNGGKWYKKSGAYSNPLIGNDVEQIWVSNDKQTMTWQSRGIIAFDRLLSPSLEMAKRAAQQAGYE